MNVRTCGYIYVTLLAWLPVISAVHTGPETYMNNKDFSNSVSFMQRNLSETLRQMSKNLTQYDILTQNFSMHGYVQHEPDIGNTVTNNIAASIEELLRQKVNSIQALMDSAEDIYDHYTSDPDIDINYLNNKKLMTEDVHKSMVQSEATMEMDQTDIITLTKDPKLNNVSVLPDRSTVHVPTTVFDRSAKIMNGANWTKSLDKKFGENTAGSSMWWQYFCSSDGFFRVFPGLKWPRDNKNDQIDFFDCRVRSWYLQAATNPKNIVILIDGSGSMKGLRMDIARSTVQQILNTLDEDDYFNILRFSDTIDYIDECFNGSMMPADSLNKQRIMDIVSQNVTAKKTADFELAFETAFKLLNETYHHRNKDVCNRAILLITDGAPEHHKHVFEKYNWRDYKRTRVFTYLIGRESDDEAEVMWMACANKGFYSHISTLADVQENVQNYIKVISRPMVMKRYHHLIWTSIYLDHLSELDRSEGLKFLTSVALPVFDKKDETYRDGNLLGVMGTDIPIDVLKQLAPSYKLGVNGYAFLINHNGYVLFHPDFRPFHKKLTEDDEEDILHPYYNNVDIMDVILPDNNKAEFETFREHILSANSGSKELYVLTHYDKMKRMTKRRYFIYFTKITNSTFRLGVVLPTTSLSKVSIPGMLRDVAEECLQENIDSEIAPWYYCNDLEPHLTGRARTQRLLEIMKNQTLWETACDKTLIHTLLLDLKATSGIKRRWQELGNAFLYDHGVDLLFVGTNGGLTKYIQLPEATDPDFIARNTATIEADYYKRAVEGEEKLDIREFKSQPKYTFTFATDLHKEFSLNDSMVTASAPIILTQNNSYTTKMGVAAVVGYRMKYQKFFDLFNGTINSPSCYGNPGACQIQDECRSTSKSYYLVDNHGYVVASRTPEHHVNLFFGDIEKSVMVDLIRTGVFVGFNFTDYQAICEIPLYDNNNSSGPSLLNPLIRLFGVLVWTVTEIALLLSQLSFNVLINTWNVFTTGNPIAGAEQGLDCEFVEDSMFSNMNPLELAAYQQIKAYCLRQDRKKIIGHRPCHKIFKLYHSDLTRLVSKNPLSKTVKGQCTCGGSAGLRCMPGEECVPLPEDKTVELCSVAEQYIFLYLSMTRPCDKHYIVAWVEFTNLLLIVVDDTCICEEDKMEYDFHLKPRDRNYTEQEKCQNRREGRYRDRSSAKCYDYNNMETQKMCGGQSSLLPSVSFTLLILSFVSYLTNVIHSVGLL